MIRLSLTLCAALAAGPALALSCMPHDVANTFKDAADAEEAYIVVHGTLSFDETKLPKVDYERQDETPPDTFIPAHLSGKSLSLEGFKTDFDRAITLNAQCFGPWCAGATSGVEYLGFLQKTPSGYLLAVSPCGGFGFAEPTAPMLEKVTACLRGNTCKAEPFQ